MTQQPVTIDDHYTGAVSPGGPAQRRAIPGATIVKLSVGPMDNNVYLVGDSAGRTLLIDAANVGAFRAAATVYRKGGVRVESTNSDLGKFTKDIVTTRIEERIALAVRVPSAVVKVTLV